MADTYAKIDAGTVVNIQMAETDDYFDPAFTWILMTITNGDMSPTCSDGSPVEIGCTYDGTTFTAAPPPS